jgi:hypothetical protein
VNWTNLGSHQKGENLHIMSLSPEFVNGNAHFFNNAGSICRIYLNSSVIKTINEFRRTIENNTNN